MKLSQLVSQYHALSYALRDSSVENDPLGVEADRLLRKIERTAPQDADDVAALARLARHMIQFEEDPLECLPFLRNIAAWATQVQGVAASDLPNVSVFRGK